jgi:transcriptional regulator with XRE-family HTH domain
MNLIAHLGAAIRQHRTLIRLSQEELADRAQLDRTYVSGIERGKRNPTVEVLQRLADALGADLDVIFGTARQIAIQHSKLGK